LPTMPAPITTQLADWVVEVVEVSGDPLTPVI
jgi:hypothetical protein